MERKIDVIEIFDGKKMVIIHDIIFKKKRYIEWKDVKEYLKRYVGEVYTILETQDNVYIGADFPNEFSGSAYTYSLKGVNVKAKANAVQAIPVLGNDGELHHYNVFHASLLIRHAEDGKKYLYDIIDIKKETSYPLEP